MFHEIFVFPLRSGVEPVVLFSGCCGIVVVCIHIVCIVQYYNAVHLNVMYIASSDCIRCVIATCCTLGHMVPA